MPANWRNVARISSASVALAAAVGLTSSALATGEPTPPGGLWNFMMTWDASNDGLGEFEYNPFLLGSQEYGTFTLGGGPNGEGGALRDVTGWRTMGGINNQNWEMTWDCVVNPDPFVDATINVTNTSDAAGVFWVYMPMVLVPTITDPTLISGSVSAVVQSSGFDPATLASDGIDPVYQAYVDGVPQLGGAQMWTPGYSLSTVAPFGSANDNASFVNLIGPNGASMIALRLRFELSAHDSASITGIFSIEAVPAPAALALFGLAGIAGGRRRRN
jgi:MYXO-CTERM domain-containing protein